VSPAKASPALPDDLSMDLVRPASVVPDRADGQPDIHVFGAGKGLTIVEGLDRSQFIKIVFHKRGELTEVLLPLLPAFHWEP
jgi:hypothetical protein